MVNGPVEIVDLPINSMVIFHSYVNVYQRVTIGYIGTVFVLLYYSKKNVVIGTSILYNGNKKIYLFIDTLG